MNNEPVPGIIIGKLIDIGGMLKRQGDKMLKPFNLNHHQFSIFFEIAKAGRVKQKEMVNRLQLEKSHVSKVVNKLHKMELITITETDEDKRSYWLTTTKKGEETLVRCTEMFGEWHKEWIGEIEEDVLLPIIDNLARLQNIFKGKIR